MRQQVIKKKKKPRHTSSESSSKKLQFKDINGKSLIRANASNSESLIQDSCLQFTKNY